MATEEASVEALLMLQNMCTSGLDLSRCNSGKPDDKVAIMTEVRGHSWAKKHCPASVDGM